MQKNMTITYMVKNGIYVNMTNRCPCACTFCLRQNGDGVYGSDSLWLQREPTVSEIIQSIEGANLKDKDELVFCGYGEPTERLYDLIEVARYVKSRYDIPIRVNTNGLSDLIWQTNTARLFVGVVDVLSISLNEVNAEDYLKITRSKFGINSYDAMLKFAKNARELGIKVIMTIVDEVTTKEQQKIALRICESLGVTLRIRPLE